MARFLIADQSLRGHSGHHYEYDVAVLLAASAAGFETKVAAHRDFRDATVGSAPVMRVFSGSPGEARRSRAANAARRVFAAMPSSIRRPALRMAVAARTDGRPVQVARAFGASVARLVDSEGLSEADHVLAHTVVAAELMGLVSQLADRPSLPRLHVVLRYEETSPLLSQAASMIARSSALAGTVRIWTDTDQLARHYRRLGMPRVGVLPIPHCLPAVARERSPGSPLTLAFLGGSRRDKGFDLLPDLAEGLRDEYLSTGRVRLVVQCDYTLSLEESVIASVVRRLRAMPSSWVTLLEGPLPMDRFHLTLLGSDVLLLPYRGDVYRLRSSGLLVQAAAAGVPTVVPESTWLADEAPTGAHVTFGARRSFVEATMLAVERHEELAAAAATAAPLARAKHDAHRLVATLTEAESGTSAAVGGSAT